MKTMILKRFLWLCAATIVLSAVACSPGPVEPTPTAAMPVSTSTTIPPTATSEVQPAATDAAYRDWLRPVNERVEDLLERMSLAEKIGQMTQVEKNSINPGDVSRYFIGSILSGGGGSPDGNKTVRGWIEMTGEYASAARETPLGIPLIYGVDAVHGHSNLYGATIFPHNIGLGATNDPDVVCQIAWATALEMLATGVHWNFSPVVAVPQDIRWGRTYEGFGENTDLVTTLGAAYTRCMQNPPAALEPTPCPETPQPGSYAHCSAPMPEPVIWALATPKHYIGDGGTAFGTAETKNMSVQYLLDQGDTQMTEEQLRALFLPPYKAVIDAGARSIMVSFSSWNGEKMHGHEYLLTTVLKEELGFTGFLVSDWQGIDQIPGDYESDVITAINAGLDMIMVPYDYRLFIRTLTSAVVAGDIPMTRIDDAVRRILTVKFELGLFDRLDTPETYASTVFSPEHRALARRAVQESLVLLKNKDGMLPIQPGSTNLIFVSGTAADDIGIQSGGWTIDWQGNTGDITKGMTILDGIREISGAEVIYDPMGRFRAAVDADGNLRMADLAIVVVSEPPYAEGVGDTANPAFGESERQLLERTQFRARRTVLVVVSGRPVVLGALVDMTDSLVAAWLPGSEGAGVADVLFGLQPFSGKLPYSWPRSVSQLPFDALTRSASDCSGPLFPFGYGLESGQEGPELLACND